MHDKRQRRQPRVAYAASVRLHSPGRRRPIDGRSINLSRSGVLIESLSPCPVGAEVICEITLPGGASQLRGHVTRLQALSPAAVGLGIEFAEVAPGDDQRLIEAVERQNPGARVVQVRFEGMKEPLRSRATLTDDGIRLTTALPFLRLRSTVEVMFLSGRTKLSSHGVVRDIELDRESADGIPRLGVNVTLPTEEETTATATTAGTVPEAASDGNGVPSGVVAAARLGADLASAPFGTPGPTVEGLPPPSASPPRRRRSSSRREPAVQETLKLWAPAPTLMRRWLTATGVLAALAVAAVLLLLVNEPDPEPEPIAAAPLPVPPPRLSPPSPSPPPPAPSPPSPSPSSPPPTTAAAPAPPRPPPLVMPPPLPAGTPGPELWSNGEETTAEVPVTGSTARMTHFSLRSPRGLAVNLPLAQAAVPAGAHLVDRDGLRFVWIRALPAGGIQVRFIFARPSPDERLVELDEHAVRVRLRVHRPDESPAVARDKIEPPPAADAETAALQKTEEN